jgi:hypothetical protein
MSLRPRSKYLVFTAAGALGAAYIVHRLLNREVNPTMETLWVESSTEKSGDRPAGDRPGPVLDSSKSFEVMQHPRPKVQDVSPNGNCMFLALATSMAFADEGVILARGDKNADRRAANLRRLANDKLCPHGAPSQEVTEEGLPVSMIMEPLRRENGLGYCQRMRRDGQWGTAAELWALSKELSRPIHVWKLGGQKPLASYGGEEAGGPLAVCYVNENHYMAVLGTGSPARSRL